MKNNHSHKTQPIDSQQNTQHKCRDTLQSVRDMYRSLYILKKVAPFGTTF